MRTAPRAQFIRPASTLALLNYANFCSGVAVRVCWSASAGKHNMHVKNNLLSVELVAGSQVRDMNLSKLVADDAGDLNFGGSSMILVAVRWQPKLSSNFLCHAGKHATRVLLPRCLCLWLCSRIYSPRTGVIFMSAVLGIRKPR